MKTRSFALFLALAFLTAALLCGQTYQGGLRGLIQDPGAAVIPGAKITLTNTASGVTRSVSTNERGEYVFATLDPGTYTLRAEAQGFKTLERKGVVISTQEFVTLDLRLEVGAISESVEVTADTPLME